MENITLSPTMSQKMKNRNAANKIRHGSPKLQEVLRERCRQRMREKRGQLFNKGRFGLEINSRVVQDTLTGIVRKELNDIATTSVDPTVNPFASIVSEPLDPEEALDLEAEILNEEEQWILEEYERMTQEELELLALIADQGNDEVICPICQKSNLIEKENKVACKSCGFAFSNCISVKEVGYLITNCVNAHFTECKEPPGFLPISENNITSLYLICDKCSVCTPII
ncbi:RPA-interacting protein [Habropoda laboriosa]|uniref:RPA-interacting protein n=2 Tax=Habropoda laboriosa TaxID=597456 RepID=A0A0L7RJ78_9HYME|nr:RPA-interacting protein [Habropoda laboriosa]